MDQLIYRIDNRDYLLMKPAVTSKNYKKFKSLIDQYSCIVQGTEKIVKD